MRERLTCPECIANFNAGFSADFIALDAPGSSSVSVSMTDPLLADTVELDEWMTVRLNNSPEAW